MSPKKGTTDDWRRKIEISQLNDMFWQVKVIMLECAGSEQDQIYLNKFETFATVEKRFVVKNISKTETLFMINQLGTEKKGKGQFFKVFEECQVYLKDKQEVPTDLMALTIKHLILKIKEDYLIIQQQKLQVKEGLQRESATMIDRTEVKNITEINSKYSQPEKPKKSKKGASSSIITQSEVDKKYNTQLRVRGEDWRDKIYVDDYPIDGANLYVAITAFQDPLLAEYLINIGIPLTAIVQVKINPASISIPPSLCRSTKRGQEERETFMEKSLKFWEQIQHRRVLNESSDVLKNTAFIIFNPPYWDNTRLSGNAEKIYDEICYLMYDIQDLSRQHQNYLNNLEIMEIPLNMLDENIYSQYKNTIDKIPLESVTLYSILDSVLEVVVKKYENKSTTLSTSYTKGSSYLTKNNDQSEKAKRVTRDVFEKLLNINQQKRYRPTIGDEIENYVDPIVINYGDLAKIKTFHLKNINLDNIIYTMLIGIPIHRLWNNIFKSTQDMEMKINYHINLLLSCFSRKNIEISDLNRLLNILACRKLYNNRSSNLKQHLKQTTNEEFKKKYLKRSILAEPLPTNSSLFNIVDSNLSITRIEDKHELESDDSKILYSLFDCPDISELLSAAEIAINQPLGHMIDQYDYFEDHKDTNSFQILNEAFNSYNCVDYKYCEVTDCIILMFFNSHDKNGIERSEWRGHLPTPVCLQDFFDFILEENYEWIVNQEKRHDEMMDLKTKSECTEIVDVFVTTSCIDNIETSPELFMDGSLKQQEYLDKLAEENAKEFAMKVSKKSSNKSALNSATGSRKKTTPASTPKTATNITPRHSQVTELFFASKEFSAYNLGDRRVEVLGKNAYFYSKDGTMILTHYYMSIPSNTEYVSLKILPRNKNSEIRIHRALGEFIAQKYHDAHESFRITSKDGLIINVVKQTYDFIQRKILIGSQMGDKDKSIDIDNDILLESHETKIYHKIYISWPNGLIIESVHEEDSPYITHVKMHYLTPLRNLYEESRSISRSGEIIIFRCDGNIEVLRPDGTYIHITKCEKKILISDDNNSTNPSSTVSSSSKRQKPKLKDNKWNKSTSKLNNDEKTTSALKHDYILNIDDFDIIDSRGYMKKYRNGTFTDTGKLLIRTITDYNLPEIFSRRMDGTSVLINKDGVQCIKFPNNTKIISRLFIEENIIYPEWTDEELKYFGLGSINDGYVSVLISYTIEHPNFATVTMDHIGNIVIKSPNDTIVNIFKSNIEVKLDDKTKACFDGYKLFVKQDLCTHCSKTNLCEVDIIKDTQQNNENEENMWWLKMKDSYCQHILVTKEGGINVSDVSFTEEKNNFDEDNVQKNNKEVNDIEINDHQCLNDNNLIKQKFFILQR